MKEQQGLFPTLVQQKKILLHEMRDSSKGSENTGMAIEIQGNIQEERLNLIIKTLTDLHDSLRIKIVEENGEYFHYVSEELLAWRKYDLSSIPKEKQLEKALEEAERIMQQPMKVLNELLFEFHLFEIQEYGVLILIKASHLLVDAPSLAVLFYEIIDIYQNGKISNNVVPESWKTFVENELDYLRSNQAIQDRKYWESLTYNSNEKINRNTLEQFKQKSQTNNSVELNIDVYLIKDIAKYHRTSNFNILLAVYNTALGRIFEMQDFAVSYTIANRFSQQARYLVGLSTHHVINLIQNIHNKSLGEVIEECKVQTTQAFRHYRLGECIEVPSFSISYLSETIKAPDCDNDLFKLHPMLSKFNYDDLTCNLMCAEKDTVIEFRVCADSQIYTDHFVQILIKEIKHITEAYYTQLFTKEVKDLKKIPINKSQEWMIDICEKSESNSVFTLSNVFLLKGKYDVKRLNQAVKLLCERHDALRSVMKKEGDERYVVVDESIELGLELIELTSKTRDERVAEAMSDLHTKVREPIMYSEKGVYRFRGYIISEDEIMIQFSAHHAMTDGGTMGVIAQEWAKLYENPERTDLMPTKNYSEFLLERNQFYNSDEAKKEGQYWSKRMEGYKNPPISKSTANETGVCMEYGQAFVDQKKVEKIAKSCRTSNFNIVFLMTMLALVEHTKQNDIAMRYKFANRFTPETQNTVGFLAQGVTVRQSFDFSQTWLEAIKEQKKRMNEDFKHIKTSDSIPLQEFVISYVMHSTKEFCFGNLETQAFGVHPDSGFCSQFFGLMVVELGEQILLYPYANNTDYGPEFIFGIANAIKSYIDKLEYDVHIPIGDLISVSIEEDNGSTVDEKTVSNILAEVCKLVLELEELPQGTDDFIELGGNSFKAFFVMENLPEEYKGKLEITDFYECETLDELAKKIYENMLIEV